MVGENDKEIEIDHVLHVFASNSMARSFESCLHTATLATCKENWQPIGIYPPPVLQMNAL